MWPFRAPSGVSELKEELENTKRQLRGLKSDVDDLWDRFRRLQGRLAKRGELSETEPHSVEQGASGEATTGALSPTFSRLSPTQRRIQLQIMQRRQMNGGT